MNDSTNRALEKLLRESKGSAIDSTLWSESTVQLRNIFSLSYFNTHQAQDSTLNTACSAVYWIEAPNGLSALDWGKTQPWFENLTCQPSKNSLAPSNPKKFKVFYTHPEKKSFLAMPRFYGLSIFGKPLRDLRCSGLPAFTDLNFGDPSRPLRFYQEQARDKGLESLKKWGGAMLELDCGAGKCLGYGTPVMMADGSIKRVQDIAVGEQLMGDDSTPRTVLSLARGREALYRVIPIKGDPYVVNESHILSLKHSTNHGRDKKGDVVDISVRTFLDLPPTYHGRAGRLLGYRVGARFPARDVPLDPYMLGYWLGDGSSGYSAITTIEKEVIDYFAFEVARIGLVLKRSGEDITYRISQENRTGRAGSNFFLNALRDLQVLNNKHVPQLYRVNCERVQLEILAGLIDSDGHLTNNTYDIIFKSEQLLDDTIFIARSLGFAAYKTVCQKTCTNSSRGPVTGTYYRTCIHGEGLEKIPVKVPRKQAAPRLQVKDALCTRIRLDPLGEGEYYGFTIDGNRRFLLGDFTVTHNTAISLSIASILKVKTLVICNRSFLMNQWKTDILGVSEYTWKDDNSFVPLQKLIEGGLENRPLHFIKRTCDVCKKTVYSDEVRDSELEILLHSPCFNKMCASRTFVKGKRWIGTNPPSRGWIEQAKIGWLQGKTIDVEDKDIVISSIDSLSDGKYSKDILSQFGLVIVDECHHIAALTLSQVMPQIPSQYVLGISATPERNDGLEHIIYWLLGPCAFVYKRLPSITGISHTVNVQQIIFSDGQDKSDAKMWNGQLAFAEMINRLAEDEERNRVLGDIILQSYKEGRKKILVVSSIVQHAKLLREQLLNHSSKTVSEHDVFSIFGGTKQDVVRKSKTDAARVVFASYAYVGEGYDDSSIDTMVLALPRSSIQQIIGRCERVHEGKHVPIVYDLIDDFSIFESMSYKRQKFYKSRGFLCTRTRWVRKDFDEDKREKDKKMDIQ